MAQDTVSDNNQRLQTEVSVYSNPQSSIYANPWSVKWWSRAVPAMGAAVLLESVSLVLCLAYVVYLTLHGRSRTRHPGLKQLG